MDAHALDDIARRHQLRLVIQFGSTVGGQIHAKSDLDIGVLFEGDPPSLSALAELTHDLQSLVPDRSIDLAVINHADPLFLHQMTERCQLLYGTARRLTELKTLAFKRYHDHRRFLDLERAYVARALART